MKFAALALTLLLAVGSQAAVLQADAPSGIEHQFTIVKMGLQRALGPLDAHGYGQAKDWIQQMLELVDNELTNRKTDIISFVETIKETFSESLGLDVERIRTELTPLFNQLRIREHVQQYIEKLGPILTIVMARYRTTTEAVVPEITPNLEDLKDTFKLNAMDTKEKLVPILSVLQRELAVVYGKVREMFDGYVQEYSEQMSGFHQQMMSLSSDKARMEELKVVANEIVEKLTKIQEIALREGN